MLVLFLFFIGISAGAIVSVGLCSVFTTVDIICIMSYKFKITNKSHLYELFVALGGITGSIFFVFTEEIERVLPIGWNEFKLTGLGIGAVFMGMFVGCLALAIDEALDGSTIFFRRLRIQNHQRTIILAVALGKLTGNYIYFLR